MHKLIVEKRICKIFKHGEKTLKKNLKKKFIRLKSVNNQKENLHHNLCKLYHIMSKDLGAIFDSLRPIYEELDKDFQAIDVVDLIYYERWLNE